MPVTKSAAKRARQSLRRHKHNLRIKQNMKSDIKALIEYIAKADSKNVQASMSKAQSSLDKAVKANIIHKNKAARQKSRLSKLATAKAKPVKATTKVRPAKTITKKPAVKAAAKAKPKPAAKK